MSRRRSASYSSARLSSPSDLSADEISGRNHRKPQSKMYSTGHHTRSIELQGTSPSEQHSIHQHQGQPRNLNQGSEEVTSSGQFDVHGERRTHHRSGALTAAARQPPPEPGYPTVDHLPWYAHKYEYVHDSRLKFWQCALY